MKSEEAKKIARKFDVLFPLGEFSCAYCKSTLKPSDCRGCPVYSQGGFDPND